jgi:hypothetical protein
MENKKIGILSTKIDSQFCGFCSTIKGDIITSLNDLQYASSMSILKKAGEIIHAKHCQRLKQQPATSEKKI